ncbi:soluble lytic murein transglycosylase [Gemmobacter aquatilis]|uniref:Soluble lytic murein transglycosylase n=1 Tax=Gemmobacter aquatilis TaxID=933059 RepID=A0A1H7ZGE1_9RHOB|nr:lytic transglycosylase domain-containing protein [Gemmobacter aquatilis]SEM57470.1 soluble lytic murein transglycosylase [Gemmobacter aquatilis]
MSLLRRLALALVPILLLAAPPAAADPATALRQAQAQANRGDWDAALTLAQSSSAVGADIIQWQRLRAGVGTLTDYEGFLSRHPDWPGLPYLREKGEAAAARSTTPDRVLAYFGPTLPQTGTGSLAVIRALRAKGRLAEAEAEARRAWTALPFSAADEAALFALYPGLKELNEDRLAALLWAGETAEAQRLLPRVPENWAALARARLALMDRTTGVTALVEAVPGALARHPLLAQARMDWRVAKDLWPDAAALMLDHSASADLLGQPEAWAKRRAQLARQMLRDGNAKLAYRIAARHQLTEGGDYADLEFLAGFIALRRLSDPQTALTHFRHLEQAVATPISVSRAKYWQARALEAAGDAAAAQTAYRAAARHQTAYYGQLAAEKLGQPLDAALLAPLDARDWRKRGFARSSVLEAGLLLVKSGNRTLAKRFFLHLAEPLPPEDLASLADLALQIREPHIALLLAKQGAERGVILPEAYFPLPDLVPSDGLAVSRALALAISRRESEFDPAARSPAGARGLMQLMPETAKRMATDQGLGFEVGRLTTDPTFNARLGSAYLAQLVAEFGPSVALVASGYNAGPGRPRRWITEFGDPRRPEVDVVDWVEMIPFTETRTYVMRVAESLVIYRAKLRGSPGAIRLTEELKG